jgi:hypothetical protein
MTDFLEPMFIYAVVGILGLYHVVRDRTPASESIPVERNKSGSALGSSSLPNVQ